MSKLRWARHAGDIGQGNGVNPLDIGFARLGTGDVDTDGRPRLAAVGDSELRVHGPVVEQRAHQVFRVMNPGGVTSGTVAFGAGTWTHEFRMVADGKVAKVRLILTEMTPTGGKWRDEMSIAGGPWATAGEGSYSKAK